jgi:UDP-N-acetylmuramate dehydrogenase
VYGGAVAHFHAGVSLASLTTLDLGGPATFLCEATSRADVLEAVAFAREKHLPLAALGGGSNVLVPDAGVEAVVLALRTRGRSAGVTDGVVTVRAEAGEPWDALVEWTVAQGWQGLEALSGIPGLTGATPIQNVGAYGQEVADTLAEVDVLDTHTGQRATLGAADCAFGYRDSMLKRAAGRFVVLGVTFTLSTRAPPQPRYGELTKALAGQALSVGLLRQTVLNLRRAKSMVFDPDDPNRRSVGSFFTNPVVSADVAAQVEQLALARALGPVPSWPQADGRVKLAAGWLIERAGVEKGLRHGAVGVSSRHALALVHHGGGSTAALLELAQLVVARVDAAFGVTLEREPVILGAAPAASV